MASNSNTYIVEEGPNPSTDYFVLPALSKSTSNIVHCTWNHVPSLQDLTNSTVIFVRYIPPAWKKRIQEARRSIVQLIYFMDDDLFDYKSSNGLPWKYRYKLAKYATRHRKWILNMKAAIWVSTPWLKLKYLELNPALILPSATSTLKETCRIFYHGSASHRKDIEWLHPIVSEVLIRNKNISFEIIGDSHVNQMYRNLPRVNIVHPMKWLSYQAFISMPGRDIGLAPALDSPFNAARSYTKFFDITHAGAVGIYASNSVYKGIVSDQENGTLVDMDPKKWVEAILELSKNSELRQRLRDNAIKKLQYSETQLVDPISTNSGAL